MNLEGNCRRCRCGPWTNSRRRRRSSATAVASAVATERAESLPDRQWPAIHDFRRYHCCNPEWVERRQERRRAASFCRCARCGVAGRRSRGIRWRRRCCSASSSGRCRDPATSFLHFRTTPVPIPSK